jgi:hypothetical protein
MVMSVCFNNLKSFLVISVSYSWWTKSPPVLYYYCWSKVLISWKTPTMYTVCQHLVSLLAKVQFPFILDIRLMVSYWKNIVAPFFAFSWVVGFLDFLWASACRGPSIWETKPNSRQRVNSSLEFWTDDIIFSQKLGFIFIWCKISCQFQQTTLSKFHNDNVRSDECYYKPWNSHILFSQIQVT